MTAGRDDAACEICDGRGVDFIGRPCRVCRPAEDVAGGGRKSMPADSSSVQAPPPAAHSGRDEPNPRDIAIAAVRDAFYANDDYGIDGAVLADAVLSALTQAGYTTARLERVGWQWLNDGIVDGGFVGMDLAADDSRWRPVFRVADGSRPA